MSPYEQGYREESKIFGGSQYLERLNDILKVYNEAYIMNNMTFAVETLDVYFQELSCYMKSYPPDEETVSEIAGFKKRFEEALKLWQDYIHEFENNKHKANANRKMPNQTYTLNEDKKYTLKLYLRNLRIDLQVLAKKVGLVMADKENEELGEGDW